MKFKKILSIVCAITPILSTVSNCSAEKKIGVLFVGPHNSGKANIINVMEDETRKLTNNSRGPGTTLIPISEKIYVWFLDQQSIYYIGRYVTNNDYPIVVLCVEVGRVNDIDEQCRKYIEIIDNEKRIKEVIFVITKVDDENKKNMIPKDIENDIKGKFQKVNKIFITSAQEFSPYRKQIGELKRYITDIALRLENEEEQKKLETKGTSVEQKVIDPKSNGNSVRTRDHDIKETSHEETLAHKVEDKKSLFSKINKKKVLTVIAIFTAVSGICYGFKDKLTKFFASSARTNYDSQKIKKV